MVNNLDNVDPENIDDFFAPNNENTGINCEYFSLEEYIGMGPTNGISILTYNIRSFFANGSTFQSWLDSLNFQHDVIILTETWCSNNTYNLCNLSDYEGYHIFRDQGRGGGVTVFVRNNIYSFKISSLDICNNTIECCSVEINVNSQAFSIVGIYRPHHDTIENFTFALENLLNGLDLNKLVILTGDFNINLLNEYRSGYDNFIALMSSLHFKPLIEVPTRFPLGDADSSPSCLDHFWTNKILDLKIGVLDIDFTDHCPLFLHFKSLTIPNYDRRHKQTFRPFNSVYLERLKDKFISTDWDALLNVQDPNLACNNFISCLNRYYCETFPIKTKFISNKRLENPWLNSGIKRSINLKSHYFKMYRNGLISRSTNNRLKNSVNREVTFAKNQYYKNVFNENQSNPRKSWSTLKLLMGQAKSKNSIDYIVTDNSNISNKLDIAKKFSEYFSSIASELDANLGFSSSCPVQHISRNDKTFFMFPVKDGECLKLIKKLKNTKSSLNEMPVKIFKLVSTLIVKPLCKIINLSMQAGIFPSILKLARISPIFKKGPKSDVTNYRPISSLHFISKIFERSMTNRLVSFFNKFDLFSHSQFGFLKNKSTTDALVNLTEHIYESLNSKNHHISILIDLKKAFDTVNNSILSRKLELYGVRGLSQQWIRSFLKDRESFVSVEQHESNRTISNIGLPQGSIISPILFLIYINDLPKAPNNLHCTLFADDTTFAVSHPDFDTMTNLLNDELEKVADWFLSNRLTINVSKTELILHTNRRQAVTNGQVLLDNSPIQFSEDCLFLGTVIDENLSFSKHVQHILKKISRNTGILFKIRDKLPLNARINFYHSFIYPYLAYSVVVWGNTSYVHIKPLILQQKRIIRIISDAGYRDHTTPLFRRFSILKFTDIHRFFMLIFTRKAILNGSFQCLHSVNTRNRDQAIPTYQRLSQTQRSVNFHGPSLWNSLPLDLKNIEKLPCFKKKLKLHILNEYS